MKKVFKVFSALCAIAHPSLRLSVSVTRVDQSNAVEVRIMQFSLYYRSPICFMKF